MQQWAKKNKDGKKVLEEVKDIFKQDEDGSKKAMLPGLSCWPLHTSKRSDKHSWKLLRFVYVSFWFIIIWLLFIF